MARSLKKGPYVFDRLLNKVNDAIENEIKNYIRNDRLEFLILDLIGPLRKPSGLGSVYPRDLFIGRVILSYCSDNDFFKKLNSFFGRYYIKESIISGADLSGIILLLINKEYDKTEYIFNQLKNDLN